jgi:hypothetical protein
MVDTPRKTFPELQALTAPVVDSDVLAVYRSPGPAKRTTASVLGTYVNTVIGTAFTRTLLATANNSAFLVALGQIASSFVDFIQSGAGAVTRTGQAKLRDAVSVKDFGAVGDGVADDTAEIAAALAALATAGGGTLLFPPGTYLISAAISQLFGNSANVHLIGYGATINGSSVTGGSPGDTTLFKLGGQRLTSSLLSASPAKGALSIATTSAIGAVAGEIVLITSTDLWNPTRATYYKGELAEVRSVAGTTLNLSSPLFDGYTAATTTVHRLAMPNVTVEGLTFQMNANQLCLTAAYARNPSIINCVVRGARYAGISADYFYGGVISGCQVSDGWYTGTGTSYSISVGSGQNLKVVNNDLSEARHNIATGGAEPARYVLIDGNTCRMHPSEANTMSLDLHGNCEYCTITNNFAEGVLTAGINLTISNNTITGNQATPLLNIFQEISSDFYIITNNVFRGLSGSSVALSVTPTQTNLVITTLDFSGNYVLTAGGGVRLQPRNSGATGCSITRLRMRNNDMTAGALQAFVLTNSGAATYTVNIDSANNVYASTAQDSFVMDAGNPATTESRNDTFRSNRASGSAAYFAGSSVYLDSPSFVGNTGGAGDSRSVFYENSGKVTIINPSFSGINIYRAESSTITEYAETNFATTGVGLSLPAACRIISHYEAPAISVSYGAAAPTTGAWVVGERRYNNAPAVGQPKSWVCTVAGTPGTWVSEGNL